jgi:hypothetical protein
MMLQQTLILIKGTEITADSALHGALPGSLICLKPPTSAPC